MTDKEQVVAQYAFLIGKHGEDSVEAQAFATQYADRQDYFAVLIGTVELCRLLAEGEK